MASKFHCAALESDIADFKKKNPQASEAEIFENISKCRVPGDFVGSPTWYRAALKDLQCMVENYGMPDVFLTLTADEVSPTKFFEVVNLETFLKRWFASDTPHLYTVRARFATQLVIVRCF